MMGCTVMRRMGIRRGRGRSEWLGCVGDWGVCADFLAVSFRTLMVSSLECAYAMVLLLTAPLRYQHISF